MIECDETDKMDTETLVVDDLQSDEKVIHLWAQSQPEFTRVVIGNLLTRIQKSRKAAY